MATPIIILVTFAIGYIIGKIVSYYQSRVQCTNCGNHNTYKVCEGYGGEGGKCEFAVKHMEQHLCKDCDKVTYIQMKLIK